MDASGRRCPSVYGPYGTAPALNPITGMTQSLAFYANWRTAIPWMAQYFSRATLPSQLEYLGPAIGGAVLEPLVSVVISTYNRADLLRKSIFSCLQQTIGSRSVEVVVVGDGCDASNDLTEEMMAELVGPQVVWENLDENHGYGDSGECGGSVAKHRALELARGEYIAYLDDDDEFFPEHLKLSVDHLKSHPDIDMVYGCSQVYRFLNSYKYKIRDVDYDKERLGKSNFINTSEVVHRRSILDKMEKPWWRMDEPRNDHGFFLRLVAAGGNIAHLKHVAATQHICLRDTLMFHRKRRERSRRLKEGAA